MARYLHDRCAVREQDDLAAGVAGADQAVRLCGLGQRERLADKDIQLARASELHQSRPRRVADLRARVRARPTTEAAKAVSASTLEGQQSRDAPPVSDQLQRDVDGFVGAHRVERGIDTVRRNCTDTIGKAWPISDWLDAVAAQRFVPCLAGSAEHSCAVEDRELRGEETDAAGRTVDQHGVAGLDSGGGQQMHRRGAGNEQPRSRCPVEAGRLRIDRCRRPGDLGGIGTTVIRDDLVTGPQGLRPGPTAVTTPASSRPRRIGSSAGSVPNMPACRLTSAGFVVVASPGDAAEERGSVRRELNDWNVRNGRRQHVALLPWLFERHAIPTMGGRPQALINSQAVDQADVVVAFFDRRLGTATGVDVSGTAEEIRRAIALGKPVHVYFSSEDLPRDVDIEQLTAFKDFKAELETNGLLGQYTDPSDLAGQVIRALEADIDEHGWSNRPG